MIHSIPMVEYTTVMLSHYKQTERNNMNKEDIKKNSPKGATHHHNNSYYKYDYLDGWKIHMHGIGWIRVYIGSATKLINI